MSRIRHRVPGDARFVHALACLAVAWGAFAFGAVYPWAYWPLAAAAAVIGAVGLVAHGGPKLSSGTQAFAVALAAVAVAAIVQLVPWPARTLDAVSPHTRAVVEELDVAFALGVTGTHSVSIDPGATLRALAMFASVSLMTLGLARSSARGDVRRFAWIITGLGAALAVAAIVQQPLFNGLIYGFWAPRTMSRPFGPFVNKNHFAGWIVMAIPLALGCLGASISRGTADRNATLRTRLIWLTSREASQAVQAGFAVVLMGVALVMSMSRSGMLSLAVALLLCGSAAIRRQQGSGARSAIVGCLALVATITVFWAETGAIAARFGAADTVALGGRVPIWRGAIDMLPDFWVAGSGLNTYGTATLFYPAAIPLRHVGAAHNEYLQLAVEGGLLVCVPAIAAVIAFAVAVRRRFATSAGEAYWIRLGAVAGIAAVAIQSLVEFSLQIPGNALMFGVLCALALHRDRMGTR